MPRETGVVIVARNKKALHDYSIGEKVEAGLVLMGTEVKSLRARMANLKDAYATIDDGEVWLRGANIPEYSYGTRFNHLPTRKRKLLLHKKEIARLSRSLASPGTTLIPLSIYFKDGYAKVELAVATGKKAWDKRQTIAERDAKRDIERALAQRKRRHV